MTNAIPQFITAHQPFSFEDLAGMVGSVMGAEIELIAAAALYTIEGSDGVLGNTVFRGSVANVGDGLLSAGIGLGTGVWALERTHNLYYELGLGARARCAIEGSSPSFDQPYMRIPRLHPYLSRLPPVGCSFDETGFNPQAAFR